MKLRNLENSKTKRGSGERFTEGPNEFISIRPAFWRVLESQKLTDENRTRTGHVGSEARQTQSSEVNNRRYDAFFDLKGVRRCSILF